MAEEADNTAQQKSYTALLQEAAANGTDKLGDEIQSMTERFKTAFSRGDPQKAMRQRCAAQLLEAVVRSLAAGTATPKALLVDVGSGIGGDVGAWRAQADAAGLGADRLDIVGVELLAKLNETAAAGHPNCRFLTADAAALPFDEGTVDGVHCSRLLIHAQDPAKVMDEMVRVLRPGGVAVMQETDYAAGSFLSGDARAAAIFRATTDATVARLANPHAARVAYRQLKARDDVEDVVLEPEAMCILDMEVYDPGLVYLQQGLDALVAAGTVERADADHYLECLRNAPRVGEPIFGNLMFKISFTKKRL